MQGVGKSKCVVYMVHGMHRVHATYGAHMALNMFTVEMSMVGHFWALLKFFAFLIF